MPRASDRLPAAVRRALVWAVTLDLPLDELRANRRIGEHWGPLHEAKVNYRTLCHLRLKEQGARPYQGEYPVALVATAYLGKGQRCDPSDLGTWAKVAIDVLVASGLLAGDDASHVRPFVALVERDRKQPRLELRVWRPEDMESIKALLLGGS